MTGKSVWGLLLGVWVSGCAATSPGVYEEAAPVAVEAEREAAGECLTFLCDEETCGFYRCEAVALEALASEGVDVTPGAVVKTRGAVSPGAVGLPLPGYGNSPARYWGAPQAVLEEPEPVFVIPWKNHHLRNLLPSQQKLLEEIDAKLNRPHEKHHLFPQAFKKWFESKGIDIHQWTMFIETTLHKSIHRGPSGGPWNAAWRQFIEEEGKTATKEKIWKHAWELCVRFGLMAPLEPYYSTRRMPPPIRF